MIDREHVLHIAQLARLDLSEEEIDRLTRELGSVLDYVEKLNEVDTRAIQPSNFEPVRDPLRDDVPAPSLTARDILRNGPSVKKQHFAVPKVIGE
jgi:aspartyl-tRNA(Asn)/glutamyl-tRNA(Gln) amidotransferase subunit C